VIASHLLNLLAFSALVSAVFATPVAAVLTRK
jgi:hypothetical protein